MSSVFPFIVVALALVAAGAIAFIAWELTSKDMQKHIDRNDRAQPPDADD